MTTTEEQNSRSSSLQYYLPWAALYLLIIGGATAFGAAVYNKYEAHHLPSGSIELTVDKTQYELGEEIAFTVTNHFPVLIYVTNQCPGEPLNVYKWENEEWIQLHATAKDDGECFTQERNVAIPSEDARSYNFNDWPSLFAEPGVYRIAAVIDHYDDIPFQDLVVMEEPEVIEVADIPPPAEAAATSAQTPVPVALANIFLEEVYEEEYEYEEEDEDEDEREDEDDEHEHEREHEDDDDD